MLPIINFPAARNALTGVRLAVLNPNNNKMLVEVIDKLFKKHYYLIVTYHFQLIRPPTLINVLNVEPREFLIEPHEHNFAVFLSLMRENNATNGRVSVYTYSAFIISWQLKVSKPFHHHCTNSHLFHAPADVWAHVWRPSDLLGCQLRLQEVG